MAWLVNVSAFVVAGLYIFSAGRQGLKSATITLAMAVALTLAWAAWRASPEAANYWTICSLFAGGVAGAIGFTLLRGKPSDIKITAFFSDKRTQIITIGLFFSYALTAVFAVSPKNLENIEFWKGFYPSWVSGIVFFSVVGFSAAIMSLYRPEKDHFAARVKILASGKSGPAVDYIAERLREVGFYATSSKRSYFVEDYDEQIDAYKVRQVSVTQVKNIYDDVTSRDNNGGISIVPDSFDPPPHPVGRLLQLKVDGVPKISEPRDVVGRFSFNIPVEISKGDETTVELEHWLWMKVGEPVELTVRRFTESFEVTVFNFMERRGVAPAIQFEKAGGLVDAPLVYGLPNVVLERTNVHPGVEMLAFRLLAPQITKCKTGLREHELAR